MVALIINSYRKHTMYKKIAVWLLISFGQAYGASPEQKETVRGISLETITQHQQKIEKREVRFALVRRGMTIGGYALAVAALYKALSGLYTLYSSSGEKTTDIITPVVTQTLQEQLNDIQATVHKLSLTSAAGATGTSVTTSSGWASSVFNSLTFNVAVVAGLLGIQYTLPKILSGLDQIYYTFSYAWFVNNRTHLRASFDELERVAFAYDRECTTESFKDAAFIVAFNNVLRECEHVLAFMQVQNKTLEMYSMVNARHMRVVTDNLMQVITSYQEVLGTGAEVPKGYFSWQEFARGFRDSINRHGESYAHNEERIFAIIKQSSAA